MTTAAVHSPAPDASAASAGSVSRSRAPGNRSARRKERRGSATSTRHPWRTAAEASGPASGPAPHTTRWSGGRIGSRTPRRGAPGAHGRPPAPLARRAHRLRWRSAVVARRRGSSSGTWLRPSLRAAAASASSVSAARAGGSASRSITPRQPRPIPHSSSPSAEWSMVTSSGTSSASAARASRAASSSRQPPLMRPIGAPCSGTRSRAPGRRYDEPRTETTVASATRAPRAGARRPP